MAYVATGYVAAGYVEDTDSLLELVKFMPAINRAYGLRDAVAVTPGASPLFGGSKVARRLHCRGTSGQATVTMASGSSVVIHLNQGDHLDFEFTHVTAATAVNLVAFA